MPLILRSTTAPSAKVIADSISPTGDRLTTIETRFHRYVLAEFNTHRAFSRNSASSRAIPAKKVRRAVLNDPAMPLHWGANRPGMSAKDELVGWRLWTAKFVWSMAIRGASLAHWLEEKIGLHKQVTNRLLEFANWHTAIVSATEWENFFCQRDHPDAAPEMQAVAWQIRQARTKSEPSRVNVNSYSSSWHLPYITSREWNDTRNDIQVLRMISVARCARVSFLNHDGIRSIADDLALYRKLVTGGFTIVDDARGQIPNPIHWSPLEHVATPAPQSDHLPGNFKGWRQLRHHPIAKARSDYSLMRDDDEARSLIRDDDKTNTKDQLGAPPQ